MSESETDEIKELFEQSDRDRNGRIDYKEFCELVQALEGQLTDEELKVGFDIVDRDGSGQIGLDEFLVWWRD